VEAADNTDLSAGVPDRVTAKNVTCVTQRGGWRGRVSTAGLSDARLYWAHGSDSLAGLLSPGWYVNWTDGDESTIVFPD
jgi:hypothetical protein